jgi:hypothetical protein
MRTELPQNLFSIDQPILSNVHVGIPERPMQSRTLWFIKPVARIQRQQLDFDALGEVGWFVDHQAS